MNPTLLHAIRKKSYRVIMRGKVAIISITHYLASFFRASIRLHDQGLVPIVLAKQSPHFIALTHTYFLD